MNKIFFNIIFAVLIASNVNASNDGDIRVKLFSTFQDSKAVVSIESGHYYLIAENSSESIIDTISEIVFKQKNSNPYYIFTSEKLVGVSQINRKLGKYSRIKFQAANKESSFRVVYANEPERLYDGSLILRVDGENIELINEVDLNSYVGGVVESEVGSIGNLEFYKVISLLVRTYAIKHFDKYLKNGYNLTDDVSSQVYFSKSYLVKDSLIQKAVEMTKDLVIVDNKNRVIFPAFHANSGGETVNSEWVWTNELPYLKSKKDPYSTLVEEDSTNWEKLIYKDDFYNYFFKSSPSLKNSVEFKKFISSFKQDKRMLNLKFQKHVFPLKEIRHEFELRSTYFDIEEKGDSIVFKGKGYGHGVGLSQIGAKNMALKGFKCNEIISFYYKGVKIVNYHQAKK